MVASHDVSEGGLTAEAKREVIARLARSGRVFITHEGKLPDELKALRFPLAPERLHDALAAADLLVGDSQTMAAEAAVLGTPNLRVSSWAGRLSVLDELQDRYQLTRAYRPAQIRQALAELDAWLERPTLRDEFQARRRRMLADKVDVAAWFVDFVEAGAPLTQSIGSRRVSSPQAQRAPQPPPSA
jgi:predicted glycosyltransferase